MFALLIAAAALLSCWNPFAAPLGLALGLASAALGARALRRGAGPRPLRIATVAAGAVAAVASLAILIRGAGALTGDLPGEPIVRGRTPAQAAALLDEEAKRTAASRGRALQELERAGPGKEKGARPGTAKEHAPLQGEASGQGAGPGDEAE